MGLSQALDTTLAGLRAAQIGDVLANGDRERVVGVGDRGEDDRPEFPVVEERIVKRRLWTFLIVVNGLQARGRFQQEIGFEFTRTDDLLRDRSVSLRGALHG